MDLHITLGPRGEHATRIYRQLLDAILDGRLRTGERLPATRDLATRLAVSRTTVALAYERLVAEGYAQGRVGAGTFVLPTATVRRQESTVEGPQPRPLWAGLPLSDTTVTPGVRYAFAIGLPDIGLFPFEAWRRYVTRELRTGALGTGDYGEPAGLPSLRAAIARHFGVSRGLRASPDDVVVTRGAQQALDLVARVLIRPGDTVAMEEPGYPPARGAFVAAGARMVPVPVDAEGLVVDALPSSARVVYVTPSHQFPLGVAMTPARRTALLTWAHRTGAVVVEDDYDSEFRFRDAGERNNWHLRDAGERSNWHLRDAGERNNWHLRDAGERNNWHLRDAGERTSRLGESRPLQPLHSIDRSSSVIYVGTFSKTMFPALRLGFLVAPASLRHAVRTAKQLTDWHTDTVSQAALAHFIDDGQLARHIRRAARHYAQRRAILLSWIASQPRLAVMPSSAGLHLTALVRPDAAVDVDEIVRQANAVGTVVRSVAPFHAGPPAHAGFMLGYGAIGADQMRAGLSELGTALAASAGAGGDASA